MKFLKKFFRHPKLIVAVCLLVTAGCGFFIKNLTLDNSIRQFFPQKDVSYTRMTETEDQFGSMLSIGLTLEAKDGTILTPEYIDVVRKITDRALSIKEVENIDSLHTLTMYANRTVQSAQPSLFRIRTREQKKT